MPLKGLAEGPFLMCARVLASPTLYIVKLGPPYVGVYAQIIMPTGEYPYVALDPQNILPAHPHFPYGWDVEPDEL